MLKDKKQEAQKIVEKIYKPEFVLEIMLDLEAETQTKLNQNDSWSLIFSKKYRGRLFLGSMMQIFQQLSGINAIVFYSSKIFEDSTGDKKVANYMTIVSGVLLMVFSFSASIFSKKYGRKTILALGNFGLMFFLIIVGICAIITRDTEDISTAWAVVIIGLIFLYEIVFSLSLGPIVWIYNADFLNSEKALGFCTAVNWACAFIIGLIIPTLISAIKIYSVFFIFAAIAFLGFLYTLACAKETFGLT